MAPGTANKIRIVVPVLNEQANIEKCLALLQTARKAGHEIIVVDGGSTDKTRDLARSLCDFLIDSVRGRSLQMNAGAAAASGDILVFVHADTLCPSNFHEIICANSAAKKNWGRFNVKFSESKLIFRIIATLMNIRSSLTGIATGDQAIFVSRYLFDEVGGYAAIPLMEDIDISSKLKRVARPLCLKHEVLVSSRRWTRHGIFRTIFLMWYLRAAYFFGANPGKLAAIYYPATQRR